MQTQEYRFKFYLNATHYVNLNKDSKPHPHTWEIVLFIEKIKEGFVQFTNLEATLKKFLVLYEGKHLNDVAPFRVTEPTLENIGLVFFDNIKNILVPSGWDLQRLEISENPSRTFIVSNVPGAIKTHIKGEADNSYEQLCLPGLDEVFAEASVGSEELIEIAVTEENSIEETVNKTDSSEDKSLGVVGATNDGTYPNDTKKARDYNKKTSAVTPEEIDSDEERKSSKGSMKDFADELSKNFEKKRHKKYRGEEVAVELEISHKPKPIKVFLGFLLIIAVAFTTVLFIMRSGLYPWGSDSWYHLFKADLLHTEIQKGNIFPLYTDLWYNGIQPLRYWAPLPHYIIALFQFLTGGNVAYAYNVFMGFIFVLGAMGWMLWGYRTRRFGLGLALALLWFFLPDNIRVLFSEGNLSRVTVTAIFPFLLLAVWTYLEKRNRKSLLGIALCMTLITFCHAMIAAMVGICLFLFISIYCIYTKKPREFVESLAAVVIGILIAGIWLYPALKGGLVSMDSGAVSELMRSLTYPMLDSLNPFLRFQYSDYFYFGLSAIIVAVLGIWLGDKKSKAGFIVTLMIFLGTAHELVGILQKIPMSQLFWMMRFTPLAMATLFAGLLLWKKLKKGVLVAFIIMIAVDSMMSLGLLAHNANMPQKVKEALDYGIEVSSNRVALFDNSQFGSFPSFYLSQRNQTKNVQQVFGSGWQGARTTDNVMWLNTALEKGWYDFLFDRCIEQGADTIILKNDIPKDLAGFNQKAQKAGYQKVYDNGLCSVYKLPVNFTFGTTVKYQGLVIGKYAANIAFAFPSMEIGEDPYLDHYSDAKLEQYQVIFLSGFKYDDKVRAENMVLSLSRKGVRFVVDMTGGVGDVFSAYPNFLGVSAQPVEFNDYLPALAINQRNLALSRFPEDESRWSTFYLQNLDRADGTSRFNQQEMDFLGIKDNDNIRFIGFNLPYYVMQTKDTGGIEILEQALGLKAESLPEREIVKIRVTSEKNYIQIVTDKKDVITGIASLDTFKAEKGSYTTIHNMVETLDGKLQLKISYPYFKEGLIISVLGILALILLLFVTGIKIKSKEVEEVDKK